MGISSIKFKLITLLSSVLSVLLALDLAPISAGRRFWLWDSSSYLLPLQSMVATASLTSSFASLRHPFILLLNNNSSSSSNNPSSSPSYAVWISKVSHSPSPFPSINNLNFTTSNVLTPSSSRQQLLAAADAYGSSNSSDNDEAVDDAYEYEEEEGEACDDDEEEDWSSFSSSMRSRSPSSRLYVGNIPYSITPSQLADVFSQAGSVQGVEVVYDRVTDRSRGFAFVTMSCVHDANEAIRMFNGAQVGGRTVKVNFPEVPRGGERGVMGPRIRSSTRGFVDSPYKVYAGNLGWSVTSEMLRLAFVERPGLLGARVVYERDTGRSRGYGFVSFKSPQDAQSAIDAMDAKALEGRPLRLNMASERSTATTSA